MRNGVITILSCIILAGPAWSQDPETDDAENAVEAVSGIGEESEAEPEAEPRTVNLIIQGTEADKWNLDVGGGWNEGDGLYGRIALTSTNFLGRGEIFGATVEAGDEHGLYELEYRRPFLFGRRQSLGIRLFHDESEHPVAGGADFDQRRTGATLSYGRRFGAHQSFGLEYRYADVDQSESMLGASGGSLFRRAIYSSSSLRPVWVFDSLDDRVAPFRGLRLAAALELAGGVLGGDTDLIQSTLGLTWFQPLSSRDGTVRRSRPRVTFSLRTRLGWLDDRGGRELAPQQRFFAGGQDSVRGFHRDSIGALADDGTLARDALGLPLGGESMAQAGLETHVLFGERFRVVFFADAGGVFAPSQGLDTDLMRSSAGAELRVTVPKLHLPLRLIYAHNLDPLPEDRFDNFSFSVGVSF